jgi:hypothetical protein
MEDLQQIALPNPGGRSFTQQLALYNMSSQLPEEELQSPYSSYRIDDLRSSLLDESIGNVKTSAGELFTSVVRHNFMNAFGIGRGLTSKYSPLADRVMGAVADYGKDLGSYMYTGKAYGPKQSQASKAMGWFIPLQMQKASAGKFANVRWGESGPGVPGWSQAARAGAKAIRGASAVKNSRLGRSMRAGFKSFLGWNYMLGNPEDMSLQDAGISYLKHTAISYGIDWAANKFLRNSGSLAQHLMSFTKDNPIDKIFGDNGLFTLNDSKTQPWSQKTRLLDKRIRSSETTPAVRKRLYKQLRKRIRSEANSINMQGGGKLYQGNMARYPGLVSEAKESVARAVDESMDMTKLGRTAKKAFKGIKGIGGPKNIHEIGYWQATKNLFSTAKRTIKGIDRFEDLSESASVLSSKMMRTTWSLGGASLRLANIASGAVAAGSIVYEGIKYRDNVRQEYMKNLLSDRMTFTMMPEIGMSGTERSRAIEAIQTSGMSLRNYLGNEANMFH